MSHREVQAMDPDNILPEGSVRTVRSSMNQQQSSTMLTGHTSRARVGVGCPSLSPINEGSLHRQQPIGRGSGASANITTQGGQSALVSNIELEDDPARLDREWGQLQVLAENYIVRFDQEQGWKVRAMERGNELAASVANIIDRSKAGMRLDIFKTAVIVLGDVKHARAGWIEKAGIETDQQAPPPLRLRRSRASLSSPCTTLLRANSLNLRMMTASLSPPMRERASRPRL